MKPSALEILVHKIHINCYNVTFRHFVPYPYPNCEGNILLTKFVKVCFLASRVRLMFNLIRPGLFFRCLRPGMGGGGGIESLGHKERPRLIALKVFMALK